MNELIERLKKVVKPVKENALKLKKRPGNSTYVQKYNAARLDFEKQWKAVQTVLPQDNNSIVLLKDKVIEQVKTLKAKAEYDEKIKALKIIDELFDELDLELHDFLVPGLILPPELEKKLEKDFEKELRDIKLVYGRSGDCTAFIFRKILEKAIFYVFAHNNLTSKIENKNQANKILNLTALIEVASKEKIGGKPIMTSKTASKLQGPKFLGDSAGHSFLFNVDMEDITPQMPFIIGALKELTHHFKTK